jgi:hypothetical protein
MAIFDGVLLVSDFDDTLVDRQKRVPERTREALAYFTENGGLFTLASGRSLESVRPQLVGLPIGCPVVASNGAQVYDFQKEQLLYRSEMPQEAYGDFARLMAEFPQLALEIYAGGQNYCVRPNLVTWKHLEIVGMTAIEKDLQDVPRPWAYAKFEERQEVLTKIQTYVEEQFPGRYEVSFSAPFLLEAAIQGCNKGNGVLQLAKSLGIDRKNIYCAGDNENDLSMLEIAEIGFVPSGGKAEPKADVVVCDCDQGAIADVIEYLKARYA